MSTTDDLISSHEAAKMLDVQPRTLDTWRCTGRHPIPFVKVGRLVKYRRSAIEQWIKLRTVGAAEASQS